SWHPMQPRARVSRQTEISDFNSDISILLWKVKRKCAWENLRRVQNSDTLSVACERLLSWIAPVCREVWPHPSPRSGRLILAHRLIGGITSENKRAVREADG